MFPESPASPVAAIEPPRDCPLCPRLVAFREDLRREQPDWWNAPVHCFGDPDAWLAIVGLAPGMHGANRTGRPFTGDFAGEVLYPALTRHGFAKGRFAARTDDGLELVGCRITNSVRCVPPENKPTPLEVRTCRRFLEPELGGPTPPRLVLALGRVAHDAVLRALGLPAARHPFGHGRAHPLPGGRTLLSSFHRSRYNVNPGTLTPEMFEAVVAEAARLLREAPPAAAGAQRGAGGLSPPLGSGPGR